jgi:DNA-binding MarR family transcriptional regulator
MTTRVNRTPADEVLLSAIRAAMAVSVRAADELGDVSTVQLRALTVLRENPGANLLQLAQAMGVTVSTTSRLVDRLVAAGFVDRRPSAQTRREISLTLTRTGRARLKRYDDLRLAEVRPCLERLPAGQREAVVEALRSLVGGADPASVPEETASSTR